MRGEATAVRSLRNMIITAALVTALAAGIAAEAAYAKSLPIDGDGGVSTGKIKELTKDDLDVAVEEKTYKGSTTAVAMTYMGGSKFAVMDTNASGTSRIIRIYKDGKVIKKKAYKNTAPGKTLGYVKKSSRLYIAKGYGSKKYDILSAGTLKKKATKKAAWRIDGIAYDRDKARYSVRAGTKMFRTNAKLTRRSGKITTIMQKGYAGDVSVKNNFAYDCRSNKKGYNRVRVYDMESGTHNMDFILTFKTNLRACEVDDDGHLLLLVHVPNTKKNIVYRTKESLEVTR